MQESIDERKASWYLSRWCLGLNSKDRVCKSYVTDWTGGDADLGLGLPLSTYIKYPRGTYRLHLGGPTRNSSNLIPSKLQHVLDIS